MRVLFVNSFYFLPQSKGGLARTLDQLATGLCERGHEIAATAELKNNGDFYSLWRRIRLRLARALGRPPIIKDSHGDYRVWRCWETEPVLQDIIRTEQPDVVVVMGGRIVPIVRQVRRCGIPIVLQFHDVAFKYEGGDFGEVIDLPCIANSHFTADEFKKAYGGESEVILPFMNLGAYLVETSRERVLFVHPVEKKGLAKAMEIVKLCPEIPFTFIGRASYESERHTLDLPDPDAVPNLEVLPYLSDMREAYSRARVLLVPSQVEESYGRVVNEAQVNGIPVLASEHGGLPEATQDGGILLPHDAPAELWAEKLRTLWSDDALYAELSEKARASADRIELTRPFQLDRHERVLRRAVNGS